MSIQHRIARFSVCIVIALVFMFALPVFALAEYGRGVDVVRYIQPRMLGLTPLSGITRGPDGAVWCTENGDPSAEPVVPSSVWRVPPNGYETGFDCPTSSGFPSDITIGPDGNLWFSQTYGMDTAGGYQFGRVTPAGSIQTYQPLTGFHSIDSIVSGPDGALWYTDPGARKVGRLTTAGVATEFPCGSGISPTDIVTGPDGALWFTNGDRICRVTTSGQLKEFPLGDNRETARGLAVGQDGALWFIGYRAPAEEGADSYDYIGRITTSGSIKQYGVPCSSRDATAICAGPDGALWFSGDKVDSEGKAWSYFCRMTTTGGYSEYLNLDVPYVLDVSPGPSGTVWYAGADEKGEGLAVELELYPPLPGESAWRSTAYFAEGFTGAGFQEYLCLLNPNPEPASLWVTYMNESGATDTQYLCMQRTSRLTVDVNQLVGENHEVSLRVVSTSTGIVAERPMYFDYTPRFMDKVDTPLFGVTGQGGQEGHRGSSPGTGDPGWTGGHDVVGVPEPGSVFFFAEGTCRPGFQPYICVMNPGDADADIRITYMTGEGQAHVRQGVLPAHSRGTDLPAYTLGVGDDAAHDFSTQVECTNGQGIVCERPMYFDYGGAWTGGHDATGLAAPAKEFHFAEGTCRPGFETYFCILNPDNGEATIRIDYETASCETKTESFVVGERSRLTVRASDFLGVGDDMAHDFSAMVSSTNGKKIVCERPMYFGWRGWTGGSDVMGATALANEYLFAEGNSRSNMQQFFSVWNPHMDPATLRIRYMLSDGTVVEQQQEVEGRATIDCTLFMRNTGNADCDFSAVVDTIQGRDILVERPMYFDFGGWTGGSDVIGAPSP